MDLILAPKFSAVRMTEIPCFVFRCVLCFRIVIQNQMLC